ncbi:MAG: PAS domain-containing protein [Syntrophales bacterium]|nr:PAS domain-containing protein [Syntrophales bacterium]
MSDQSAFFKELSAENAALKKRNRELEAVESELMRLKKEVTEEREVLKILSDNAPFGMVLINKEGQFIYVNAKFSDMFGYDLSDVPDGRTWFRKAYPNAKYRHMVISAWVEDFSDAKPGVRMPRVFTVVCRDDREKIIDFTTSVTQSGYFLMVCRDIGDYKFIVEALRKSEAEKTIILESVSDNIFYVDRDLRVIYSNKGMEAFFNLAPGSLTGKTCYKVLHKRDEPCSICPAVKAMSSGTNQEFLISSYGRHWNLRAYPVSDESGRIIGAIEVASDITERIKSEDERKKLQEQLTRTQKLESIGTLAGGIAHDFNNLLMGIQGNASLVLLDIDPSHPHFTRLKHIEEHVASGADLTKQLLGFSRSGRYDVKPLSMNDIVKKSSAMFGRTKKEISIHRKYSADPCIVEADSAQMEQVFLNLLVNAWHAMPGGGDIFIETERIFLDEARAVAGDVKPGFYIKVNVTDTGIGMDEKTKDRIFDPFFTTKDMGRGSGLGLATVYGIIKGHGGMINVYSEPGHGTTFTLYLPASDKCLDGEKESATEVLHGTETILIVDDEALVLDVSRDMLESLGYRVYVAGNGQEAVVLYSEKKDEIDLVILDMIMPEISGSSTVDKLRQINPRIKVLLASGYSINGEAQSIMERGCNGFIQKPFQLEQLSRCLRDILD